MAKQNMGGVYANMEFPPYEFREYPKQVNTGPHGKFTVVHTRAEEDKLRQQLQKDHDDAPAEYVPHVADPEKEILISRARELGVPFNSKWSKAKLKITVQEAEADVDSLPAEQPVKARGPEYGNEDGDLPISSPPAEGEEDYETPEELKAALLAKAKSMGINPTGIHLWGIPRLKSAIAEAAK